MYTKSLCNLCSPNPYAIRAPLFVIVIAIIIAIAIVIIAIIIVVIASFIAKIVAYRSLLLLLLFV
jgi:hypothetical protein